MGGTQGEFFEYINLKRRVKLLNVITLLVRQLPCNVLYFLYLDNMLNQLIVVELVWLIVAQSELVDCSTLKKLFKPGARLVS